jgi:hypothetical protein
METTQGTQPVSNNAVGPAAAAAVRTGRPCHGNHNRRTRARGPPHTRELATSPGARQKDGAADAPTSTAPEGSQTREEA